MCKHVICVYFLLLQLRMCPGAVNLIKLSWSHDYTSFTYYFFAVYLVKRLSTKELCDFLKTNCYRPGNFVRKQIIAKLASSGLPLNDGEDDDDIQIQNTLPVQLLCPLSKCRINLPVRGKRCQHIQCYDADTYFIINERKPAWKCPVCDLLAPFDELFVDGLLMEILESKKSQNAEEIVFNEDGSWTTMKSSSCGGVNGNVENSRGSSPLSTSNGDGQPAPKISSTDNPSTSACGGGGGGGTDVLIDLTASDDDDGGGPQPPKRPAVGQQSLSCSAPSRQHSSSSMYRVPHPPPSVPSQHDSLSNQFLQQQHRQHQPVPFGSNLMRCAHSNSVPSTSAMSNPALLVDAKPDTRRVFLSSHAPSVPASRPCSHSDTPSPRTPQSLGHAASTVAKSSLSIPQMVSSSNHHNIPVPLNLNAKELMAKMAGAASFSPQMLEAYMKLPECNQFPANSVPQLPPPKAAHQNNGNSNNNNISHTRFANFLPPYPAHSNLALQNAHQWRTQGPPTLLTASNNTAIGNNSSAAHSSFLFPSGGSGGGVSRAPSTCSSSSSPTFLNFWPSAVAVAAAQMTSAHPMMRQSLGDLYRSTLPPSPPHAHSSNSTPPPPPKGDPRHLESGGLFSSPSGWSTNHQ
ncbi:unnamed protein product [Hymenolepis diminuta]|uniref:SP-RING-type domain-containing protein n=1 Tax=Hymenolepis diminuta TaxID=6216 RepID=A0A564YXH9_HYMDI|nr:unnamed protein product [Hymenolepis diminuta]